MSVDWERYSTAEESLARAKKPAKNGIVRFVTQEVRAIDSLTVEHRPSWKEQNRAHSEILGDKRTNPEVRVALRRAARWAIPYSGAFTSPLRED